MWAAVFIYLFPSLCTWLIYIRITTFLRHRTNNLTVIIKQRQERDFLVIKRILISIILLLISGMPGMIFVIIYAFTNDFYFLTYRIIWFSIIVSMLALNVILIFYIPQLKNIFNNLFRQNQLIVPTNMHISTRIEINTTLPTN